MKKPNNPTASPHSPRAPRSSHSPLPPVASPAATSDSDRRVATFDPRRARFAFAKPPRSGDAQTNSTTVTRTQIFVLVTVTFLFCGCQSLTYTGPSGERFTRRSFGAKTAISSLTVEATTNGLRRVELRGYTNDSTQALGAVTEAAVRAAIQGAK